ncbi:hypothetical protein AAFF_G00364980 [Aldrovandia affinis]|uniref:C-type lectin domain-containing protein n=1 Tax=Aldrovandia affinis TaxID=143900 RepID=A0AAD7VZC4_9TELE|nr:hypothetical protein AAFF_G00364980 [Aldrovandia affinis]
MPTLGWRWLLGFSTLPLVIFALLCFWLPESARYDVLTGHPEKAMTTLRRIATENKAAMPLGTLSCANQEHRGRIQDLFCSGYWKTTCLLWFIWFSFAFSYFGLVLLTSVLLQSGDECGVSRGYMTDGGCSLQCNVLTSSDYKDLLWTTLSEFPGLLVTVIAIDRIGRRKTMALCFLVFAPLHPALVRLYRRAAGEECGVAGEQDVPVLYHASSHDAVVLVVPHSQPRPGDGHLQWHGRVERVCRPCPEGWEESNSKCYYFSTEKKSWNDSRSDCLKQGADLVIIESKDDQDFISKHTRDDFYWIGLSDSETEGTFLWVDGTPLQEDKA